MSAHPKILVATGTRVLIFEAGERRPTPANGLGSHAPTCLASDPWFPSRAWCGTKDGGLFRSDDGGASWTAVGLQGEHVTAAVASPARTDLVWVGTEPSAVWRSRDGGRSWTKLPGLLDLPSSSEWSFPPRPDTHHVRWIACHPTDADRLWVAVEAGALLRTVDGGENWMDRVPDGPRDTHELAVHPAASETLRVAAGDGYFESDDGGGTWFAPTDGLEVDYLRSVVVDPGDPEVVVVSASSSARTAYVAGRSDGRLYRREGEGPWVRVTEGWPRTPSTIAPLLTRGPESGELWAADERGVHHSIDGGVGWERSVAFPDEPSHLRGLAALTSRVS